VTDEEVDAALHEVGRRLGVEYDEHGHARPPKTAAPMISTTESLALYAEALRELHRADELARKRQRFHLVKK
jgi:hypothetical protein